jgi:hypothetical protein
MRLCFLFSFFSDLFSMTHPIEDDQQATNVRQWFASCWTRLCRKSRDAYSDESEGSILKNQRFVSQAGKEVVTRDSNFDGLLHDPLEENIISILPTDSGTVSDEDYQTLMRITSPFHITVENLTSLMQIMEEHCQMGLDPEKKIQSDLKMLPTYVTHWPTRQERGDILALDLGGTNFRTLLVKLDPDKQPEVISEAHIVPDSKKNLARELFEFIADVLKQFMIRHRLDLNQEYVLGFTFSFACEQVALNKGTFLTPSKGWGLSDLVGQDVVGKLQTILYDKQLKVQITALINDTVGTLMACGTGERLVRAMIACHSLQLIVNRVAASVLFSVGTRRHHRNQM